MDIETIISRMSREQCRKLLEAHGFAVYDSEPIEDLREAIQVNVDDGTIAEEDIYEYEN